MKNYSRTSRIAEQMQRDLAALIRTEIKDPRIGLITITGVDVSRDYSHAKIFFTQLGDEKNVKVCGEGLNHSAGFLRHLLAQRLGLRVMPMLHFVYDESVERGIHLSQLIDTAVRDLPPIDSSKTE